ncbi:MAG TPA: DUF262 domain-containing protein, partial [Rikenellaceae bacterium]|nr:DUF262 domain-containing protein [Rikenellaceae bacterium]
QFKTLDLVPISELISSDFNFYVPSYQRGYRWGADQVNQLIEDLEEFEKYHYSGDKNQFYCLQPLVVKERNIQKKECDQLIEVNGLEIIDGQQRLTTILLLLQALHLRKRILEGDSPSEVKDCPNVYSIRYETREDSIVWLPELNKIIENDPSYKDKFVDANCDYFHFAEVFDAAYNKMKDWDKDHVSDFSEVLRKGTRFIWYYPTESAGTNTDIFDRLNAGKIGLNNAELIKALFLQNSNWSANDLAYVKALSLEWNSMENRLQNKEFWGFIYRSRHPFAYDTHIEYLFDLLQKKEDVHRDTTTYTFNRYLDSYRQMMNTNLDGQEGKAEWVRKKWSEVKELFDTLNEWYNYKPVYHRVGFVLEYVASEDVLSLRNKLDGKKHSKRIEILDGIIKEELNKIKSQQLFYGKAQMSEILFFYNILLEDRRISDNARFSFADYKEIYKNKGWDQEHVASHTDFSADDKKAEQLATDIIELIVGEQPTKDDESGYFIDYKTHSLDGQEKDLCERALRILNSNTQEDKFSEKESKNEEETDIAKLYEAVQEHFKSDEDEFGTITLLDGKTIREEKDFIWNFVLLNAETNRSYGNHIFPVKRRRILQDEFDVYTPIGTRNVFEKAYSRKIDQILYWSKTDARSYWEDLKSVLSPYIQLSLPFNYKSN